MAQDLLVRLKDPRTGLPSNARLPIPIEANPSDAADEAMSKLRVGAKIYSFPQPGAATPDASETVKGKVELATTAEATAGTDTERAVTPAGLAARTPDASETAKGLVELATNGEVDTGTDTSRAVTPAGLARRTPDASTTAKGVVELATGAEVNTGTDTGRAVTPAGLAGRTATTSRTGLVEQATNAEIDAESGTTAFAFTIGGLYRAIARKVKAASTTVAGIVELATTAEATAGTDTSRAVTPAGLAARTPDASTTAKGLVELATTAETTAGTADKVPDAAKVKAFVDGKTPDASDTAKGLIEIATQAEANALTDTGKALTPGRVPEAGTAQKGIVEAATTAEMTAGTASKYPDAAKIKAYVDGAVFSGNFDDLTGAPAIFNRRGAWTTLTAYAVGDVVVYNGDLYYVAVAVPDTNTTAPSDGSTWVLLSSDPTPDATATLKGKVELATNSEASAGTDTSRAVTPAGLAARTPDASTSAKGLVEAATTAEMTAGTADKFPDAAKVKAFVDGEIPTDSQIGDKAFSNPPSDLTAAEKAAVRSAFMGAKLTKDVAGSADVTLTAAEASYRSIRFTGALTGNIVVTIPSAGAGLIVLDNGTSGSFTLKVKASGQADSTAVTVAGGVQTVRHSGTVIVALSTGAPSVVSNTEAEYAALTPDANTFYISEA